MRVAEQRENKAVWSKLLPSILPGAVMLTKMSAETC